MTISVLTNVTSLDAQRNLNKTQNALATSIGRLSSGMRINNASDDAAGLGISQNLSANIRSMAQAQRNANDAISMSQVAEGSMNDIQGIVSRMRELSVQASNGTLGHTERGYIQTEFSQLRKEIDRISAVTDFNGQKLLNGSAVNGLNFQIGINKSANDTIAMSIATIAAATLGTVGTSTVAAACMTTATLAQQSIATFDKAIQQLSQARANVGAVQNRMTVTVSNLGVTQQNLAAANSRIMDVDVASESSSLTKSQILAQAGLAVLAQANSLPQSALKLLQ